MARDLETLLTGQRNYWYPILLSEELPEESPVGVKRLGEELVVWRNAEGKPVVQLDRCPHRGAKLSLGALVNHRLMCRYHGLQFSESGRCELVPMEYSRNPNAGKKHCVKTYPAAEYAGLVFAYIGDTELFPAPPFEPEKEMVDENRVLVTRCLPWEANWMLVRDNTPDPAHLAFVHGALAAYPQDDGSLKFDVLPGEEYPLMREEDIVPLLDASMVAKVTERNGLAVFRNAEQAETGEPEIEWVPPALARISSYLGPYFADLLQFETPIDENRTMVYIVFSLDREKSREAPESEQREYLEEKIWPGFERTFKEDSWMLSSIGNPLEAREREQLLPHDKWLSRVRRMIIAEYERQQDIIDSANEQRSSIRVAK